MYSDTDFQGSEDKFKVAGSDKLMYIGYFKVSR